MSTSTTWKWLAAACLVPVVCAGCIPVITGGNAEVDVYIANDPDDRLVDFSGKFDGFSKALLRSQRASRAVVIPCCGYYSSEYQKQSAFQTACVVTTTQRNIFYSRRLDVAVLILHGWYFTPFFSENCGAWVFTEGGWPVHVGRLGSDSRRQLVYDGIRHERRIPWGLSIEGTVICYPDSRPWDKFIAAGAGCEWTELTEEDDPQIATYPYSSAIGTEATLRWVLSPVPCRFIKSVDDAKGKLTDEDRLVVFRQTLLLYEHTQSYWNNDKPTSYGTTRRESCERNTRLLRERIESLEAKARK